MNSKFFKQLSDINMRTELLESLGWDEEALARLTSDLASKLAKGDQSVESVITWVKSEFGETSAAVIEKIFNRVIFNNNLHVNGDTYEN
tara:strand:- start:569 stop:835 length:267 start_codon:yes stop_codon:yes gene_type:complete